MRRSASRSSNRWAVRVLHVNDSRKVLPRAQRPILRNCIDAELRFNLGQNRQETTPRTVHFVDERDHRDLPQGADTEQLLRLSFDPFRQVNHHHGTIGRHERAIGVFAEVMVPRRVEQIDLMAFKLEGQHSRTHGDAALLLQFHPVGRGRTLRLATADRSRHVDATAEQQQLLGERCLAGVRVRDDGERSPPRDFALNLGIEIRHIRVQVIETVFRRRSLSSSPALGLG